MVSSTKLERKIDTRFIEVALHQLIVGGIAILIDVAPLLHYSPLSLSLVEDPDASFIVIPTRIWRGISSISSSVVSTSKPQEDMTRVVW